jgi:hypothetical protein
MLYGISSVLASSSRVVVQTGRNFFPSKGGKQILGPIEYLKKIIPVS